MLVFPAPLQEDPYKFSGYDSDDERTRRRQSARSLLSLPRRASVAKAMSPPLHIALDASDTVVLRGYHDAEPGRAVTVTGKVVLKLLENASIKDIHGFHGRARTSFTESTPPFKSHHLDEILFAQEFSLLESTGGHQRSGAQTHTLPPGDHEFPFTLDLPPELPASLIAASGAIDYRIKITVFRPGFTSQNWVAKKPIFILHGLNPDAVEYSSSLDIENDWPGKVSYAFTIPSKAHAMGSSIPIHVKFVPHVKGVKVTSLTTIIRENSIFYSKHHSANVTRDIVAVRHDLTGCPGDASPGISPVDYRAPDRHSAQATSPPSAASGTSSTGMTSPQHEGDAAVHASELLRRLANVSLGTEGPSGSSLRPPGAEEDMTSTDINTIIRIPLPSSYPPSHSRAPIVITHRIKWSALIQNADGHTSELRCALPLTLLAPALAEEARLAASGATNLLFGPSGVLLPVNQEAAQVQLPSYSDHVHDRIANAQATPFAPNSGAYVPTAWAASARSSPEHTPLPTPSPSRPGSPTHDGPSTGSRHNVQAGGSSSSLFRQYHEPIDWADEGLRGSLTPAHSPPAAMERQAPSWPADGTRRTNRSPSTVSPPEDRSNNRFHMHLPKPLRSFTQLTTLHSKSNDRLNALSGGSSSPNAGPSHPSLASVEPNIAEGDDEEEVLTMATPRRRSDAPAAPEEPLPRRTEDESNESGGDLGLDVLRQVPPYEVAANWLGGGVVPLETQRGLPSYSDELPPPPSSH